MKRFRPWVLIVCLSACVAFAQGPAAEPARVESAQASVTVVFAPDYNLLLRPSLADSHTTGDQRASLRSVDTPPTRILGALTGGRINADAGPVEFPASKGLVGIKTGVESVMASTVTIGENGKLQFDCSGLPQALERMKSANRDVGATGKEAANDR